MEMLQAGCRRKRERCTSKHALRVDFAGASRRPLSARGMPLPHVGQGDLDLLGQQDPRASHAILEITVGTSTEILGGELSAGEVVLDRPRFRDASGLDDPGPGLRL